MFKSASGAYLLCTACIMLSCASLIMSEYCSIFNLLKSGVVWALYSDCVMILSAFFCIFMILLIFDCDVMLAIVGQYVKCECISE